MIVVMDYLDFHVKIGPRVAETQYAVAARSPSVGETNGVFTQPLTDEQLELFVLKVGLARRGVRRIQSPEWRAAQDFGQKLFRSLFTDEIRAAYLASHNDAVRQGKGLRLKLSLDAPELANYPWEFLFDPSNSQFLSLFEDTPILRYIELSRPPLRILAVAASPQDYEQLDLARERRNFSHALDALLRAGLIELDWLATATLDALREQLLQRPYHIFHFIGHGGFDEKQQDGILIFENAQHYANRVSGERLAVILGNHRTLRLAILNACEGARTSQQDPFAGSAMTLVRTGNLPAVIAMQYEISDVAAIDFASGFYAARAAGRPVDAAMSQGRQAIFASDNDVEWSTPVLYLRAPDGVIFQVDARAAEQQADQERLAREKLQAEEARIAREKLQEGEARVAREKLQEDEARVAREKLQAERAEQDRLKQIKIAQERAAQANANVARVEPARSTNVPPLHDVPECARPPASNQVAAQPENVISSSDTRPMLERLTGFFMAGGTLLLTTFGVWVLGLAVSRMIKLERRSSVVMAVGWLVGYGLGFGAVITYSEFFATLTVAGLVAGGSIALAIWTSNRDLARRVLGIIFVSWLIGFMLQAIATVLIYRPLSESVWEWLQPLQESVGPKPLFVLQIWLATLFIGAIAPLIGIPVMNRQLQHAAPKE